MTRLPSIFLSHGAPSYALDPGLAGQQLIALGQQLPKPKAILVVSPHWMTSQPKIATSIQPETIHDFGGFTPALYQLQYPAAGHPQLAMRAIELLRAAGWQMRTAAGVWITVSGCRCGFYFPLRMFRSFRYHCLRT